MTKQKLAMKEGIGVSAACIMRGWMKKVKRVNLHLCCDQDRRDERVLSGSVTVEKEVVSSIGRGVLVFAAVAPEDTEKEMESMASKVLRIKMWDDEAGGRWKRNVADIQGEVLCVSQFTLLAKTTKGTKPDFHGAANPQEARRLYEYFVQRVRAGYLEDRVMDGRFQAMMQVALVNDGPVTLELNVGSNNR